MPSPPEFPGQGAPENAAPSDVTRWLRRMAADEPGAVDAVFELVYGELRRIARGQRRRRLTPELDTTALIHEAYLRFSRAAGQPPEHREHFYAVAARAMRQILLDEAKHHLRHKRGGDARHTDLDPDELKIEAQAELMVALDRGLEKLGRIQVRARQVVECRYFGGMSERETAAALGVDVRTIRRDWAKARAWLADELGDAAVG
ncbi:MAG: ECF-type sigma factor [Acidobacteriota bacterium]